MLHTCRYILALLITTHAFWVGASCPGSVAANFTTSGTEFCGGTPLNISFTNTSTGPDAGTVDYEWYLDGVQFDATTGLTNPGTSTLASPGTYSYMLVAVNGTLGCSDTAVVTVVVHPVPVADFSFAPNNACAGTTVGFTNSSMGSDVYTTYLWDFGDGNTSTATNPTHSYTAGGTFNVTLTMTNGAGCASNFNQSVTAQDIPFINISGDDGDGDLTYCLLPGDPTTAETVTFNNATTGATSYTWDFGDGSPTVTTASTAPLTHDYTSYGTFTVTMTATHANGCTSSQTLTVVFEKFVSASITLDITEYSGCTPHPLTSLQNLSVNANTYTWDFGDGTPPVTTSDVNPPAHIYNTPGTYSITMMASNSCNSANVMISPITIIGPPTASFAPSTSLGCAPQNVSFTNTSVDAQPANNFQWDMGNGNTYTNTNTPPFQGYDTSGVYTVTLTAGNSCGTDVVTANITIDTIPTVDLTLTPNEGCTPLVTSPDAVATGQSLTWAWYVNGVYVSGAADSIPDRTFTAPPGNSPVTHNVQVNVSNHCGSDSDVESVIVHPQVQAIFNAVNTICEGESITFTDASLGDDLSWSWDFGEGTTAATQGPHTLTYNTAGTYTVSLDVSGYCGNDQATMTITVNPYPVADFVPVPLSGCIGDAFDFTNNSTPGGTYSWNFGAEASLANSSAFTPPSITYLDSGYQMITLDVDLAGCSSSDTAYVDVLPLPVPDFTLSPASGCSPLQVDFINNTVGLPGYTWTWDFGNGNISSSQTPPTETYVAIGASATFDVWLVVEAASGCADSVMQQVAVDPLPMADFTALPASPVCVGETVNFTNLSTLATSYAWDFGDGNTSTATSPSHAFALTGTYNVELVASTAVGCTDTFQMPMVVDTTPTADFGFSIECTGFATVFTDASFGGVVDWAWDFGDGQTSTLQDPSHLYAAPGTYSVSLTVTNAASCSHTLTQSVPVNAVPVADFSMDQTCDGGLAQFNDLTSGVPNSWEWDFGDGSPISTLQNPSHLYPGPGSYDVEFVVLAGTGCSDTILLTVEVDSVPVSMFSTADVCTGEAASFNSFAGGNPDSYYWDFGDGNVDASNNPAPTHTYATANTYTAMLVVAYSWSGCSDTSYQAIESYPRTGPDFSANTACLLQPTDFTDLTTNTPVSWAWDFGDGTPISTLQNPTHLYAVDGVYTVKLITENAFGCVDSVEYAITVNPLPVADFEADSVCLDASTQFSDLSVDATAWEWDFGDGSGLGSGNAPTHLYGADGTFSVRLVASNGVGCTDTLFQDVVVYPNPVAQSSVDTACFSFFNSFSNNSVGGVQYSWDFGDGSPLDAQMNPTHTYPADGQYSSELIVTNVFGCTDTTQDVVVVLPQPEAGYFNSTVCAEDVVSFTDTTTSNPDSWTWDFGDGSPLSNTQHPTHTYATGGLFDVMLAVGNGAGCTDTTVVQIEVYTVPVPAFTADTVCLFNITSFTDLTVDPTPIAQWFYDFDDGNDSYSQHPTYIYQNPGVYNVSLTVTNIHGCDSTVVQPVFVNDIPIADFDFDTVCLGQPISFTDLTTGAPPSYIWDFGDGNFSTTTGSVQHTYSQAGTYLVSLLVDGGTGCLDQAFHAVVVNDVIALDVTIPDTVCTNEVFGAQDNSTITTGIITGYSWDFGDGTPLDVNQNALHAYTAPGVYTITHTVSSNQGCNASMTQNIVVDPLPTPDFSANLPCEGQSTSFLDQSTPSLDIISWNWDFGDATPSSSDQHPVHQYASAGTYNVTLTVGNADGCVNQVTMPVVVHETPQAGFFYDIACPGDVTYFQDNSSIGNGTIASWDWDFLDGDMDTVVNPDHVFTADSANHLTQLVVTSDQGCTDTSVQVVNTHPTVIWDYGPISQSGCAPFVAFFEDYSITTGGGGIVGWTWEVDGYILSFADTGEHTFANAGDYYVSLTVTTAEGCVLADTLAYPITVYPVPEAGFVPSPTIVSIGQSEVDFIDASTGGVVDHQWDFGDGNYSIEPLPTHEYLDTGLFQVMQVVINNYGCLDTAYSSVRVNETYSFHVPNVFTPNGDGRNDFFQPHVFDAESYDFMVFDRWGELIFRTDDVHGRWDGTYKGKVVKDDVYVWKAEIMDTSGEQRVYYGHVTVMR